jgi:hypothetical protein
LRHESEVEEGGGKVVHRVVEAYPEGEVCKRGRESGERVVECVAKHERGKGRREVVYGMVERGIGREGEGGEVGREVIYTVRKIHSKRNSDNFLRQFQRS